MQWAGILSVVLMSHRVTSSNPGCTTSHPTPCLWPGKTVEVGSSSWRPMWEIQKNLPVWNQLSSSSCGHSRSSGWRSSVFPSPFPLKMFKNYLCTHFKIYLKKRVPREIFPSVGSFLKYNRGWVKLEPGSGFCTWVAGSPALGPLPTALPGVLAGNCIQSGATGMGSQHSIMRGRYPTSCVTRSAPEVSKSLSGRRVQVGIWYNS